MDLDRCYGVGVPIPVSVTLEGPGSRLLVGCNSSGSNVNGGRLVASQGEKQLSSPSCPASSSILSTQRKPTYYTFKLSLRADYKPGFCLMPGLDNSDAYWLRPWGPLRYRVSLPRRTCKTVSTITFTMKHQQNQKSQQPPLQALKFACRHYPRKTHKMF